MLGMPQRIVRRVPGPMCPDELFLSCRGWMPPFQCSLQLCPGRIWLCTREGLFARCCRRLRLVAVTRLSWSPARRLHCKGKGLDACYDWRHWCSGRGGQRRSTGARVGTDDGSRVWEHCNVDVDIHVHLG